MRTGQDPEPPSFRIGVWGAPASGKTTFLAAMFLAAEQLTRQDGHACPITVVPKDGPSEEFMRRYPEDMLRRRRFPGNTTTPTSLFEWQLTGDLQGTRFSPRHWPLPARHLRLNFVLRMRDLPGEAFRDVPADPGADSDVGHSATLLEMIDELAECDGLVFLFDPIRESTSADSIDYFNSVLIRLRRRLADAGRTVNGKLPHRLAVCVTKFDDERTFAYSQSTKLVKGNPSTDGQPLVPARSAERYFHDLCRKIGGGAEDVSNAITAGFLRENIRYYAVSSVGFFSGRDAQGHVIKNQTNAAYGPEGATLRSRPRPINVLDAVLNMERTLRGAGH